MAKSVTLVKGKNNMIGISIGGGVPFCPVLYIVQVCAGRGLVENIHVTVSKLAPAVCEEQSHAAD